jgi:hypothetical protein
MSRLLDIVAGVALFCVGAEYAFMFFVGLVALPFFAEPLWRTELGMVAGMIGALAALTLFWSRRIGAALGFAALFTLAVILVWNRLSFGHLSVDSSLFMFLTELAVAAALLWWRFVFITDRRNQSVELTATRRTRTFSDD